ncbi:hypothetical protein G6F37_009976 [Rhizopus arrhizus]|jgi:uncharacterized Zn-finger protein|nr:hypothetical protein G6F38_005960 [Rhizopus arrhizus]KAG1153860.1 hypothetical protein G6F37_009976 [Rhizopus arrhizus]
MSIQSGFQDDQNNSILKFMNPNMKEQRRFSYTSMLSDPCYLPVSGTSSPSEHSTPSPPQPMIHSTIAPFIDPIYVDINQQKNILNGQSLLMNFQQQPHPYYDLENPTNNSQNDNSNNHLIFNNNNNNRYSPVSPPLTLKEDYSIEKKSVRSRGRRVSNIPGPGTRMFICKAEGCGKVFKRSEHLKRHIRSIHTLEKRN